MKKVTIMVPTYNQPQYIEQCIESAIMQDYPNLEIVISDDSTNDDTEKIIFEKYAHDSRIYYFHNKVRLGRVGNYHHTLYEKATGDYVINLDGDDWFLDKAYISKASSILDNNNNVACVIAKIQLYHENEKNMEYGEGYRDILDDIDDGGKYLSLVTHHKAPFNHMTVLYRREKAMKIGFYIKDTTWTDSESIFRLVCNSKIAFVNQYVGVWRIHGMNESSSHYKSIKIEDVFANDESIYAFCSKCEKEPYGVSTWIDESMYHNAKGFIKYLIQAKQYERLLQFLKFFYKKYPKLFFISLLRVLFFLTKQKTASLYRSIFK